MRVIAVLLDKALIHMKAGTGDSNSVLVLVHFEESSQAALGSLARYF